MFGKHRDRDEDLDYDDEKLYEDSDYDDLEYEHENAYDEDDDDDDYLSKTSFVVGKLLPGLIGILLLVLVGCFSYQFVLKDKLDAFFHPRQEHTASVSSAASVTDTPVPTVEPTSEPTIEPTIEPIPEPTQVVQNEAEYGFSAVDDIVTAKSSVNLRSVPSTADDSTILGMLYNGDTVQRTGVSDDGWSSLIYNGIACYAVTSYLTDDLSYVDPEAEDGASQDDGIQTQFEERYEEMTAKEEVNLRTIPSVTNPDSVVIATIWNGEIVVRTGINTEVGWSRVEYQGQTLYCISSYITTP